MDESGVRFSYPPPTTSLNIYMKFGHYSDNQLPMHRNPGYVTNSHGYRCPEFKPLPDGGKNVVVLGCSHTFGQGLETEQTWVSRLASMCGKTHLRFWNLGQPGASPQKCVRILTGTEKLLFPNIIIMCWPFKGRRERLDKEPADLMSTDPMLKHENEHTDTNIFLQSVFQVEKFAERTAAKVFHCFAQDVYEIQGASNVLSETTIRECWPEWDKHGTRESITKPDVASDGKHYGAKHHNTFAKKFYDKFRLKLK